MYTQIIIKKCFTFFCITYKNEWKEHKFWWQKNQKKQLLYEQKDKTLMLRTY